jgi:hypothetical protein
MGCWDVQKLTFCFFYWGVRSQKDKHMHFHPPNIKTYQTNYNGDSLDFTCPYFPSFLGDHGGPLRILIHSLEQFLGAGIGPADL